MGEWETKPIMENNIGVARNTALEKANGYATRHNIAGSGPVPHQAVEEVLSHQLKDT